MTKLLRATFFRLKRSKLFLGCLIVMAAIGGYLPFNVWRENAPYGYSIGLEQIFFCYSILIGFVLAVFISLFVGTEYSDGAIRNKIVVGHRRTDVYLTALVSNFLAALALILANLAGMAAVGVPLLGGLTAEPSVLTWTLVGTLAMTLAFCALLTLVSMTCSNKAAAAVIGMVGVMLLFLAAAFLNARLDAPEFLPTYSLSLNGEVIESTEPNPHYLQGTERAVYQFFYDLLPTGQAMQYSTMSAIHLWQMPLYALGIAAASTVGGLVLFRRKDLK